MKAMLVDEDQNLVWSEVDNPIIKDDEVFPKIEEGLIKPTQKNMYF
ncbi:MAG: hypothetical protein IKM06_04640 [Clostridia bacterium]|nr:hypothetical protein [Clostridia bacterium]